MTTTTHRHWMPSNADERTMSVSLHRAMVVIPATVHFTEFWCVSPGFFREFDAYVLFDFMGRMFTPVLTFCFGMNMYLYRSKQLKCGASTNHIARTVWIRAFVFMLVGVAFNIVIWGVQHAFDADILVFYSVAGVILPCVWWLRPRSMLIVCALVLAVSQYAHMNYKQHISLWEERDADECGDIVNHRALRCVEVKCNHVVATECVDDCFVWWQCVNKCVYAMYASDNATSCISTCKHHIRSNELKYARRLSATSRHRDVKRILVAMRRNFSDTLTVGHSSDYSRTQLTTTIGDHARLDTASRRHLAVLVATARRSDALLYPAPSHANRNAEIRLRHRGMVGVLDCAVYTRCLSYERAHGLPTTPPPPLSLSLWNVMRGFVIDGHFTLIPFIFFPLMGYYTASIVFTVAYSSRQRESHLCTGAFWLFSFVALDLGRQYHADAHQNWVAFFDEKFPLYPTTSYIYMITGIATNWALMAVFEKYNRRSEHSVHPWFRPMFVVNRYLMTFYVSQHLIAVLPLRALSLLWYGNQWQLYEAKVIPVFWGIFGGYTHVLASAIVFSVWERRYNAKYTLEWCVRRFTARLSIYNT